MHRSGWGFRDLASPSFDDTIYCLFLGFVFKIWSLFSLKIKVVFILFSVSLHRFWGCYAVKSWFKKKFWGRKNTSSNHASLRRSSFLFVLLVLRVCWVSRFGMPLRSFVPRAMRLLKKAILSWDIVCGFSLGGFAFIMLFFKVSFYFY